ncbi:MAG TPA: hypothetical protein VFT99_17605 [Roseiflexaceae bacterium]|nr:hypothetical protein [Roseiflexaceae bacterium]
MAPTIPTGFARLAVVMMLLGVMLVFSPGSVPAVTAQQSERCFLETGFCIGGPIRAYWERNGGLAVFGYPISNQQIETVEGTWSGPVQWFERDRLEDHGAQGVMAGRLGARYLELQGRPWVRGTETPPARAGGPCRYFETTGYNICNLYFRIYWEQNGGLERFGYPITPAFEEQVEGKTYTVQYFERRRMEYHPELAGTPYEVLLGLLGRDILNATAASQAEYTSADGAWSVTYPAALLHPEDLGDGLVIFLTEDRKSFAAIHSFDDQRNMYGNTGEELRNSARDALLRIYGQPHHDEEIVWSWGQGARWQTGFTFRSPNGAQGAAMYEQRDRPRVNGFLYAAPPGDAELAARLQAVGRSFRVNGQP